MWYWASVPIPKKSHKKFIEKHELPFPLIADEDKSVHEKNTVHG